MPHLVALGSEIAKVGGIRSHLQRHPLRDADAERFQTEVLGGIIGEEAHFRHPQIGEDLAATP